MTTDPPTLEIEIQRATTSKTTPADEAFQKWVRAALSGIRNEAVLAIRIVDIEEGQQINRRYRDKDYATNVLSFPADLPTGISDAQLGDLLICAPVVANEAKEQGKPEADHWAHLTVHGVLHLLGYDHENDADTGVMESLEIKILNGLGISNPYQ
jgi:probable rRNA maturation factor